MSDNPRLLKQAVPLLLLKNAEDERIDGTTRFQKLVFLAEKEAFSECTEEEMPSFGFGPHNYGPYSNEFYDILDLLVEKGLINRSTQRTEGGNEKHVYTLAEDTSIENIENIDKIQRLNEHLQEIENEFGDMPLFELLDYVYDTYPEMTTKSVLS